MWSRRRDEASKWAVLTFASLGAVTLASEFIPENSDSSLVEFLETVVVAVLLLFPYFLFRLAAAFSAPSRPADIAAGLATLAVVIWAILIPRFPDEGETPTTGFKIFVIAIVVQWVGLSSVVALRFWRAGAGQPDVARKRMRMLAIAASILSLAIVVAGTASGEENVGIELVTQVIVLVSVGAFFLAFAPPSWLRVLWRRDAEKELRKATAGLLAAASREEIAETVLPHAAGIVGGLGIAMYDNDGVLLGTHGLDHDSLSQINVTSDEIPQDYVRLAYPFGCLVLKTSRHTPFFGEEDINLLGALGTFANLAMQRLEAADVERQLADAKLRRRQALEINDNVVQRLAVAHYSFELGRDEEGKKAMQAALVAARKTISDLLDELPRDQQTHASTLTRSAPATEPSDS